MATPFHVELVTPERVLFSGEADKVFMRTDEGEIAFLAHHEDFIGAVDITVARINLVDGASGDNDAGEELVAAVHGGFVHVDPEGVRILASVAELAEEIDVDRARAALEAAEQLVENEAHVTADQAHEAEGEPPVAYSPAMVALLEPESADARLRRARVRLEAAGVTAPA
jgi:F-type H+-transporting ATPase subunit epsilon